MFRSKMDTVTIARHFNAPESEIANELHKGREEEYADNINFTVSPKHEPSLEGRER